MGLHSELQELPFFGSCVFKETEIQGFLMEMSTISGLKREIVVLGTKTHHTGVLLDYVVEIKHQTRIFNRVQQEMGINTC